MPTDDIVNRLAVKRPHMHTERASHLRTFVKHCNERSGNVSFKNILFFRKKHMGRYKKKERKGENIHMDSYLIIRLHTKMRGYV